jgi:hypothetical protein
MAHRQRESVNAVRDAVAEQAGAKVRFGFSGRSHQVAEIELRGRTRKVYFSCSPSDRNGYKQAAKAARRVLAELSSPTMESTQ